MSLGGRDQREKNTLLVGFIVFEVLRCCAAPYRLHNAMQRLGDVIHTFEAPHDHLHI